MKSYISFALYFTASKLLGYIIFMTGALFAFLNNDPNIFIFSSSIAAGLLGLKTWQSAALEKKKLEFPTTTTNGTVNNGNSNGEGAVAEVKKNAGVQKPADEIG
jgi:hypothetical protein